MITCGNRKAHEGQTGSHLAVADVRACFEFTNTATGQLFTCGWLCYAGRDEDGEEVIRECGAPAREVADGWECLHGHEHATYGSARQQAEEAIEAAVEYMASRDGSIAARLDAGESARQIAGV